jgi:phenylpropionate dioxygenase-like ring-hydroxylating dioxygenase large terminal subunit
MAAPEQDPRTVTAPGAARAPGPDLQELLSRDKSPPEPPLRAESYRFLGDADIPYAHYTSSEYARAELEKLWPRVWQWACREEHIPEPGDYYVYDVGDLSALVVRTESGAIKAFHNACMHRGTQLKPPGSCGASENLRCPFHGWVYALDGSLIELPERWDFPHVTPQSHRLTELRVDSWAGFVFVSFDAGARPLAEYLGALTEHFREFRLEDRYVETHVQKRLPCNWKAAAEAFLEAYHVKETHAGGAEGSEVTTQYDVFGEHVTRFVHTIGSPNPRVPQPSEQQLLDGLWARGRHAGPAPRLEGGRTARDVYAEAMKRELGERYGRDLSHYSTSLTLDSIEYFLFPNAFFFPGLTLPMVYRFRPDPRDPDFCTFDLLMLRPRPTGRPAPPPPEPLQLGVDDSYTLAKGLGILGAIYDQDTGNLAAQTRGFKASLKRGQTLGNYQEMRIRHLHQTVERYLAR